MNILDTIAQNTRERYKEIIKNKPYDEIKAQALAMPKGDFEFEKALKGENLSFICEVKKASPSKGVISEDFAYLQIAKEYESAGASAISCLTELSGEMVTDRQRRFIESAFDAVTASQYGCNEIGSIAYECPEGNLHVMDHNVYVEIEPFTEQERAAGTGHVIVTARHNKVMPFIRYDTGDIAGWKDVSCTCGCHGAVLELTGARKDDIDLYPFSFS